MYLYHYTIKGYKKKAKKPAKASTENNNFVYQHTRDSTNTLKVNNLRAKGHTGIIEFSVCIDVYQTKNVAKKSQISRVFIVKDADWQ
jgi:hypothetical protein